MIMLSSPHSSPRLSLESVQYFTSFWKLGLHSVCTLSSAWSFTIMLRVSYICRTFLKAFISLLLLDNSYFRQWYCVCIISTTYSHHSTSSSVTPNFMTFLQLLHTTPPTHTSYWVHLVLLMYMCFRLTTYLRLYKL